MSRNFYFNKMRICSTLLIFLISTHYGKSARILGIFTTANPSHYILGSSLMKGLAEAGHDVTMVSSFGENNPPKNYKDIVVTRVIKEMDNMNNSFNMFDMEGSCPYINAAYVSITMNKMLGVVWEDEEFQKLIHSNEKFDVVIVEQFFNDAQKALAAHFGAPLIVLSSMPANFWVNPYVGNPAPPSYVPDIMLQSTSLMKFLDRVLDSIFYVFNQFISNDSVSSHHSMTFMERLVNTYFYLVNQFIYNFFIFPHQNELIKKNIPNGVDLNDALYNVSLVLLNSHPSISQPIPHVPNMIEIGGYHINKPPKKLPDDLQEFLDNAKDGVIYFSMGSNLKSAQLPLEKREALLKTFSKLKENVLWKWEEDVLPGQPPNVKVSKWLPQQDILAHPNVKLFITHGGLLSTIETIYHGVPILAIPILGDQKLNAKNAVNNGYGVLLPYSELSEETLSKTISEILNNPKYKENAKIRSKIFRDRQVSPMETAIYWIEYVIRHKGAPHLRVAALDLPWYKYHSLDVIAFKEIISVFCLFIGYYIVKRLCKKNCTQQREKKLKKN